MRYKLKKRCKTWGCPNLHYNASGYCDECTAKWRAKHPTPSDLERPTALERGYDGRWRKFAKDFLSRHQTCAICGAPATVVDHKEIPADVMIDAYGQFDLDEDNYQALCNRCNVVKGLTVDRQRRNKYFDDKKLLDTQGEG